MHAACGHRKGFGVPLGLTAHCNNSFHDSDREKNLSIWSNIYQNIILSYSLSVKSSLQSTEMTFQFMKWSEISAAALEEKPGIYSCAPGCCTVSDCIVCSPMAYWWWTFSPLWCADVVFNIWWLPPLCFFYSYNVCVLQLCFYWWFNTDQQAGRRWWRIHWWIFNCTNWFSY